MNMFNQEVEGFWQVGAMKFKNKFPALVHATNTSQEVRYIYFDDIWKSVDRKSLGKKSLKDLYKERAVQLRDSYDYLILYFSGGADSYNVLRTFIDNNISLDEVCVKWPMAAIRANVYKPNVQDTSARNTLSEWDFAIKPVLDWLSKNHPQIKINIVDWTDKLSPEIYTEDLWHHVNTWNDIEIPFMLTYSESELLKLNKGKKVGSIYGIDKPILGHRDNDWFFSFTDTGTGMGIPSQENRYGTEYFYWSPNFPLLAMEQAYQLSLYIDSVPGLKQYYYSSTSVSEWEPNFKMLAINIQNSVARKILYDNWNGNFQADKPFIADREDKHFWLFNHPELCLVRDSFLDMNSLFLSQLDKRLFLGVGQSTIKSDKQRGLYRHIFSKWHYIRTNHE